VDKISAITLFESFRELVGQFSPPIRLQIDHSTQVTVPPPSHTLNTNITLVELLSGIEKTTKEQGCWFGWYEN